MDNINTNYNKGWEENRSSGSGGLSSIILLVPLSILWFIVLIIFVFGECAFFIKQRVSRYHSSQGGNSEMPPYNADDLAIIEQMGWCCERCKHVHELGTEYTLGVYPIDGNDSNKAAYNRACLCRLCWSDVQGIKFELQSYETAGGWFKPHLDGYFDYLYRNEM